MIPSHGGQLFLLKKEPIASKVTCNWYKIEESNDPNPIFKTLSSQDWSFTDDDTRYLTHDLHPYPAKFIPQIPAHLISRLSLPGDVVLDPSGGSATTAVEAVRLGRRAVSFEYAKMPDRVADYVKICAAE